ncbi:Cryptochrome/photolyase FAD-binding domain-containing protein [Cucurbitaria berberidis CBS 394.84]|uniref:Cryptochrome/photolyase FAD-binding domain-containing protein n=1 Tax=Cucurbitaria berberidis CBS 394.84 TaxID=1168544 RepID=A0A9P4G9W4_9PLEO|nr:Cryptochrome/photolyase FAD-binding domain-containing protein [Cucurbitaria berberidis CBS 394.84]KAF1841375.1 Cryptochrome/photolyase FAD-binding domain-containing protein [Cucurbitaria berberidis CBS 394.84]
MALKRSSKAADFDSHAHTASKRTSYERSELGHTTTERAKQVDQNLPYDQLKEALEAQDEIKDVTKVAHWFHPKDLRIQDNTALHHASQLAQSAKKPLICLYINCAADESWHGTSPARIDFMFEGLNIMQKELKELNIPLVFLECEDRKKIVPTVIEWFKKQNVSHVFGNYEYEIDEMRRDIKLVREAGDGIHVSLYHDQTVVEPGTMLTGSGTPMKVFTPYFKHWLDVVRSQPELLDTSPPPAPNSSAAKKELQDLFDTPAPKPAQDKQFQSEEARKRIRKLWPPGHAAGSKRMDSFLKQIDKYAATRSNPAKNSTSRMSPYFSAGMFSVREALQKVVDYNKGSTDFTEAKASKGVYGWVREIVFRELYRQTTLTTPHTSMNLPQNLKFDSVEWEDDEEGWEKWYKGQTGEPFIDAGMRQLNHEAYMHNRLRMNVSSYLYCNLLLDYRRGERYFAETLIDWDLSNNTQGWEPSYTVFNPVSQAEKNDPEGEYIRKWVPELAGVQGKAVFAPYERLSKEEFEKLGYPKPHVDWKVTKQRCTERFKKGIRDAEA